MAFYLLFLFPTNLEAHNTMALAHHPTPVLPIVDFWCLYPTEVPWSEHHPKFFSAILPNLIPKLKPPLLSQWPTITFSPLFFPDNLPFSDTLISTVVNIRPLYHNRENIQMSLSWSCKRTFSVKQHHHHQPPFLWGNSPLHYLESTHYLEGHCIVCWPSLSVMSAELVW